ncbi:neuronal-glial cell adhesion molecule isoform X2 [Patella vulgata]|nr:neuronal-glial cell adhesion molecule isoform X2 [Patella vulgata]
MEMYLLISITCLIAGTNGIDRDFPPIIKEPIVSQTKYEQAGAEVIMACKADANPPAEYEWKWNGDKILNNEHIEEDSNSGEIRFKSLTPREMGDFQCYAYNRIGGKIIKAASAIITVEVAYLNSWETNEDLPPRISVEEGEPVKLTCDDTPSRNPPGQFKWYRGDEDGGEVIQDKRIAIDAEGSLHFAYALKAVDLAGEEYKCAIFIRELNSINLGSGKILDVKELNPIPERKPNVVYYKEIQKALVGYDVDIECVFSGYPLATITWKDKDQQEIPTNGRGRYEFIEESHRILRINKVVETDEGTYTCSGTNKVGSDDRSTFLNVTSRPIWVKALSTLTIVEKRTAPMTCKTRPSIREGPNSPPEWFENGDPISQVKFNSGKYVLEDNGQILRVNDLVKPDDITCYQCKVTNSEGFTFGSGCLDVIEPIEIIKHPEGTQVIKKGDMVDLTFIAESDPAWTLYDKWYFNDEAYPNRPPFVTYNETANTAYINTESLTDEEYGKIFGVYTREIFHQHERKNISTLVQEKDKEEFVRGSSPFNWWNLLYILLALVILAIIAIIIYCCCCGKTDYNVDEKEKGLWDAPKEELKYYEFPDLPQAEINGVEPKRQPLQLTDDPVNFEDDESLN